MSKLFAFLFVLAALVAPRPARALPTQNLYRASYGSSFAGLLAFEFDSQVRGACEYMMSWEYPGAWGEQCVVDEVTSMGHRSCVLNALEPVPSLLTLSPAWDCYGFDSAGQSNEVYLLVLAESPVDGALEGLVQLGSAGAALLGFHAEPILGD